MKKSISAVAVMILCGGVGLLACGRDVSAEEHAGSEFARSVMVQDFKRTYEYVKGEDTIIFMIGPASTDLFNATTAPGWTPAPYPSELPNNDEMYENLILGYAKQSGTFRCRVGVARLRPHQRPPTTENMSQAEITDIVIGRLVYISVTVGCRKPQ